MREHVVDHRLEDFLTIGIRGDDQVKYVVASDPATINQYYQLVERVYQYKFSESFQISAHDHMLNSIYGKIIVAIDGNGLVIGGARVVISRPEDRCLLPLESTIFTLRESLPFLNLENKIYSEWGRFAVDPKVPNKKIISENIARMCVNLSINHGSVYQFGLTVECLWERINELLANMGLEYRKLLASQNMPPHPIIEKFMPSLGVTNLHNVSYVDLIAPKSDLLYLV